MENPEANIQLWLPIVSCLLLWYAILFLAGYKMRYFCSLWGATVPICILRAASCMEHIRVEINVSSSALNLMRLWAVNENKMSWNRSVYNFDSEINWLIFQKPLPWKWLIYLHMLSPWKSRWHHFCRWPWSHSFDFPESQRLPSEASSVLATWCLHVSSYMGHH